MPVETEVRDGVAVVTLNRPTKLNAIDPQMRSELRSAWRRLADPDVRVAVVTGAGDRAFSVGSDLGSTPNPVTFAREIFDAQEANHLLDGLSPDVPLIAAINGYAIGGGLEIALACDIRICADAAQFGLGEARVGSIPGAGGTQLVRTIGRSQAMQMLLTGDRIDAETALRVGLVSEVTDADGLLPRALAIATRIASNAPLSVRAIKRLVRFADEAPRDLSLQAERMAFGLIKETWDRAEGRAAFTEKRDPRYRGE